MVEFFVPDPSRLESFHATDADDRFAESFANLNKVLNMASDPKDLTLRISTCRNAYLTLNALFRSLAEIVGFHRDGALISKLFYAIEDRKFKAADGAMSRIVRILQDFQDKLLVWERRHDLDAEWNRCIKSFRPAQRHNLEEILRNVRTSSEECEGWDKKYFEVSLDEPRRVTNQLAILRKLFERVRVLCELAQQMRELEDAPLFAATDEKYQRIIEYLSKHAQLLGVPEELIVDRQRVVNEKTLTEFSRSVHKQVYDQLCESFQGNKRRLTLPDPFVIDVSDHPVGEFAVPPTSVDSTLTFVSHRFSYPRPESVRISLASIGVPTSRFDKTRYCYCEDGASEEAWNAIDWAVRHSAETSNAQGVIFPEYCIPRSKIANLQTLCESHNVTIIGGVEGRRDERAMGLLVNEAIVLIPGRDPYFQLKVLPSVDETPLASKNELHVFFDTPLGNFAIVVCSDLLELDILAQLSRASPYLDHLIVCSLNDYPDLFCELARADAVRLYAYVLISNCCYRKDGTADRSGSGVYYPSRLAAEPKNDGLVAAHTHINFPSSLVAYSLSLSDLMRGKHKPSAGFLNVPYSRGGRQAKASR